MTDSITPPDTTSPNSNRRFNLIWLLGALAALIPMAITVYFLTLWQPTEEPMPASLESDIAAPAPPPLEVENTPAESIAPPATPATSAPPVAPLPSLNESDQPFLTSIDELPGSSRFTSWFGEEEVLRKLVVVIDNIAQGKVARKHIAVPKPTAKFPVNQDGVKAFVDPQGYQRFDRYVDIFIQLDPKLALSLYQYYRPLLEQAYSELGYPKGNFDQRLRQAIDQLLETPDEADAAELTRTTVMYKYADPTLERLPAIQKQLLRMGPRNVELIKKQLKRYQALMTPS